MFAETACRALREGKCLSVTYDGYSPLVEVHAVGYSKDGALLMRVYQVKGGSVSGDPVDWKLMRVDKAWVAAINDQKSGAPRLGYKRNDRAIAHVICQL